MNQDQNPYQFPDSMNPQGSRTGTSIGALLGKTYALLAATLVVSAIAAVYGMSSPFAYEHPFILMIGSFALLFAVQYTGAHRSPFAIPLVFLFAAGMGMMMGPAIEMYLRMPNGATVIAEALGTTAAMFIGLSAYAMTTRRDFSNIGGFLITGLILAIVVTLLNMFLLHLPALQLAIAGVLVLVFSGLILFDTQRMVRGGIQEPVLLVVGLYLDIINLFMALLEIFGGGNRS
ncbi:MULTISPECIES: Bax inhibitor-1/YccA family protein [Acidithiobacillus]|uniref:Putative membrane protein n=1 Tax=Acidithiobacillus thiooxidans ATCC 19377 TaxID=637390 RepID=A0A543Q7N8_ACITH|nr:MULTISPECIES: Bax inhibitor-1 family protein [Acidithiobacillus]MBE7565595.1 Bax inhibitor-1 family protein [Acidithiobacillus sp. HP-11]MBU2751435.1 transporter [Acidithiobacillus thiooxidans]MBU2793201.1 transporter [Acidithiobacillus thiooxidans]MDX5936169.1 Bax inhibitor-1 family protein [Acidithiobacillus thiooxidans]TQN52326.1 putative membrane protein [Acidithiobacillus thiooxidans ATCC 19377]